MYTLEIKVMVSLAKPSDRFLLRLIMINYDLLQFITIYYNLLRFIINYKPNYLLPIGGPSLIPSHCHALSAACQIRQRTCQNPTRNDDGPANLSKPRWVNSFK